MKLKEEALSLGVEEKCYRLGPNGAYSKCRKIVMDLMSKRYDDVSSESVRSQVTMDLHNGVL